jgi:hypothetical protein
LKRVYDGQDCPISAVCGPSELHIYGVDVRITKFSLRYADGDPNSPLLPEECTFEFVGLKDCLSSLQGIKVDEKVFRECLIIAGSSLLKTFPPLLDQEDRFLHDRHFNIDTVLRYYRKCGGNVRAMCQLYPDNAELKKIDYFDRYMRIYTAVKHMIVLEKRDLVVPLEADSAPDNLQDCIGLKLPEELFYYIFVGMISPKVPQWLNSSEILIQSPYEGADVSQYQHLVKDQLGPLRQQCLSLLAFSMHRSFQHKTITTRFYMGPEHDVKFNIKDLNDLKDNLSRFKARDELLTNRAKALKVKPSCFFFFLFEAALRLYFCRRKDRLANLVPCCSPFAASKTRSSLVPCLSRKHPTAPLLRYL